MSNEELENLTMVVLNAIINSDLENYTKLEALTNLRLFLYDYKNNIKLLSHYAKIK